MASGVRLSITSCVAPFAGAWIEIDHCCKGFDAGLVAPFAGAWIEIVLSSRCCSEHQVAPFAGAWIEMDNQGVIDWEQGRSLRGSVD